MYSVIKQYCISDGPCNIGDVLEIKPSSTMVKITVEKKPKSNLLTRGENAAKVIAHNLPFDRRMNGDRAFADNFKMLYAGGKVSPFEFWSIEVSEGNKATLKKLTTEKAEKVFDELPQKLGDPTYFFDPEAFQQKVNIEREKKKVLKEAEERQREQAEEEAKGPLERFIESPPLKSHEQWAKNRSA